MLQEFLWDTNSTHLAKVRTVYSPKLYRSRMFLCRAKQEPENGYNTKERGEDDLEGKKKTKEGKGERAAIMERKIKGYLKFNY